MTMDRPRRADRRTSDEKRGSKDAWRGHEPQWFKDQERHDDQRVPMARGTGEPASGPEELTHAEGHHWQPARSGHDEAAARGYGGPPRAPVVARPRRTEVLDDDGRQGGEFQARDVKRDEDEAEADEAKRDGGEKVAKRSAPKKAARKMSKAPARKAAPKRAAKAAAPKRKAATKTKRAVKARATKSSATKKKPAKSRARATRKAPASKRR